MTTTSQPPVPRFRYRPNAYKFVFAALRYTQEALGREAESDPEGAEAHISGAELLDGIRRLAHERFGLMAVTVFHQWGIRETDDFGRIVFELIEQGEMRKTDRDQLGDFTNVYDFHKAFDLDYRIDPSSAFSRNA